MKLFEPEKPFEHLSNHALVDLVIDGRVWKSVAHYTYACPHPHKSILWDKPSYTVLIQHHGSDDLHGLHHRLRQRHCKALNAKFQQHYDLQYLLLQTLKEPLVNDDHDDPELGMVNNKGKNYTGVVMTQIRSHLKPPSPGPLFLGVWLQAWIASQYTWIHSLLEHDEIKKLDLDPLLTLFKLPKTTQANRPTGDDTFFIIHLMLLRWKTMVDLMQHCHQFEQAKRQWIRHDSFDQELEHELKSLEKYSLSHPIPLVWHRRFW